MSNEKAFDGSRSMPLAEEVLSISAQTLTQRDRKQLNRILLDHLACCYRGSKLPWGEKMQKWAAPYAGSGKAGVLGAGMSLGAPMAAFVNATAAHGLELDDTHDESVSHPGAGVIATAFATAMQYGKPAASILPAIVAGYEVAGRLGAATNAAAIIEKGFHPTCLFTGFGAVATAAHIMELTPKQLAQAWGLMLSMAGGSMQFSQESEGTTVKRLHGGLAALHGVTAAELASLGVAGPEQALDGRYGLISIFGGDQAPDRLIAPHADGPEIHRISFKPYACCRLFHSTLDALEKVTDNFSIAPEQIQRLLVGGPEIMVSQHMLRRPVSEMAAQYSLPFCLGAAFYYGPRSVDGYMEENLSDSRVLTIADKVDSVFDQKMEDAFPAHFGSWIEIELADGSKRRAEVLDSLGTPANPMPLAALIAKFDGLVAPTPICVTGAQVIEQLEQFETTPSIEKFLKPFLE